MRVQSGSTDARATRMRVLVADDDARVRSLFARLLRATTGIASVIEAQDGAEAVELGRQHRADVAVLDLNMPRLDGVEAALRLRALHRSPRIALQSSDPELLRQRASGLGLPLFDKADPERLLEWVARQAKEADGAGTDGDGHIAPMAPKVDLSCSRCGYGIVCRTPPERCPMCSGNASWIEPRGRPSRHALLHERLPG